MNLTVAQRVANGVKYLMDYFGGSVEWLDRIDVDRLDVANSDECVIGQVFGGYCIWSDNAGIGTEGQRELGFEAVYDRDWLCPSGDDYHALNQEWTRVLTELQEV